MTRPWILTAVVLTAALGWLLLRAPSAHQVGEAAGLVVGAGPDLATPVELSSVPLATAATEPAAAPVAGRLAVEPRTAIGREDLRLVCAATGKGVPRFRLLLLAGARQVALTTNLDGWVELPAWARSGTVRVSVDSAMWGYRQAGLLAPGFSGEPSPAIDVKVAMGDPCQVDWVGPNFLLADVPGANFQRGFAPYGDFGHRVILEPDLVLCLDFLGSDRAGVGPFELRGNAEPWIGHGDVVWEADRIASERVLVEREARSNLEVALHHPDGSGFKTEAQVELVEVTTGASRWVEVTGERATFRTVRPGLYRVEGLSRGLVFGPLELELLPFQSQRVDLAAVPTDSAEHVLDLELNVSLDQDVVLSQMPAELSLIPFEASGEARLKRHLEGLTVNAEGESAEPRASIHWVGSGSQWTGQVHFPRVPVGYYAMSMGQVLASPGLLQRALDDTELVLSRGWADGDSARRLPGIQGPVSIYRNTRASRTLRLSVPVLERVDVTWDLGDPSITQAIKTLRQQLDRHEPLASRWAPDHARLLFALDDSNHGLGIRKLTNILSWSEGGFLTLAPRDERRQVEPGYMVSSFELKLEEFGELLELSGEFELIR